MEYYGCSDHFDSIKKRYDGYQFGNTKVYCPWDGVCHLAKIRVDQTIPLQNYWINTSGNDAVKRFIFATQITEFFKENVRQDANMLHRFCDALQKGDAEHVEHILNGYLRKTISYAHDGDLPAACQKALQQIADTRYEEDLADDGMETVLKYGIVCYKKRCKILVAESEKPLANLR